MTPEQLAAEQREFLIGTEKQSAILLLAEFERMKREFSEYLARNFANAGLARKVANAQMQSFLAKFTDGLSEKVDNLSSSAAQIVARAQRRMINFTGNSLKRYLPSVSSSIFEPDKEAIQILIGRTQTGVSLKKFFQRMNPVVAENATKTLIEGFSAGESNQQIARRIEAVTGAERHRVLTIARTETNEAYRAASREFYQSADIKQYVWLSVLDSRTCAVCWYLHGHKFKSAKKIFSHPNCRCVLVPWTKNQQPIATGAEHFAKLEAGFQKQILGEKKFEIYKAGKSFDDFFSSRMDIEYGQRFFVKNLSDL